MFVGDVRDAIDGLGRLLEIVGREPVRFRGDEAIEIPPVTRRVAQRRRALIGVEHESCAGQRGAQRDRDLRHEQPGERQAPSTRRRTTTTTAIVLSGRRLRARQRAARIAAPSSTGRPHAAPNGAPTVSRRLPPCAMPFATRASCGASSSTRMTVRTMASVGEQRLVGKQHDGQTQLLQRARCVARERA